MGHVSNAVQLNFQRHRDLLLHFLGGVARPLGDDLRVGIRDIGVGLNRQIVERENAPDKENNRDAQDQNAVAQGEVDEKTDHLPCSATAEENSSALATICSPGFTPSRICCIWSDASPPV